MKFNFNFVTLLFLTIVVSSCSMKKSDNHDFKLTNSYLAQLDTGSVDKTTLLKNLSLSEMGPNELATLVSLRIEDKINDNEFRSLFWGQERNKEALFKAASLIEQNGVDVVHLSKLDQTVIRSIAKDDVSFEQITDDLKSDSNLESRIQPQLITEIVRVFNRDFTKVINDEVPFYKKIGVDKIENDEGVYNETSDIQLKLLTLLKLSYYNQILSRDDLVSPLNNAVGGNRNVNSNFSFQYNIYLARCGSTGNSLNFNNSIEQSFGQSCPTETATSVNLDLANVINSNSDFYRIDLLINTFVRGGYDRGHGENGTGSLSYNLNGTITIPKCLNPSECSQFVNLKTKPSNYSYPNSNLYR